MSSTAGMRNASVLPLPVFAAAKISLHETKLQNEVFSWTYRENSNPVLDDVDNVIM